MRLNFNSVDVVYAPRDCKKLARSLEAYGANQCESGQVWPEAPPNDVNVHVASILAEPGT